MDVVVVVTVVSGFFCSLVLRTSSLFAVLLLLLFIMYRSGVPSRMVRRVFCTKLLVYATVLALFVLYLNVDDFPVDLGNFTERGCTSLASMRLNSFVHVCSM